MNKKILTSKTKTTAFEGVDPVGSKSVLNNNIIEQTNISNYPGNSIA